MTSKVEELRDELYEDMMTDIKNVASAWGDSEYLTEKKMKRMTANLDSLISASHAEGVAEGAEQERQRVRDEEEAESLRHDQECDRRARQKELGIDGLCDYIRTHPHDPSVLAPTKEKP